VGEIFPHIYFKKFMKHFLITLFVRQNKHHKHSVLIHTLKVFWKAFLVSKDEFYAAALLHDIGKPFVATLKKDGYNYSFTNHEEKSYQIIKNWPFISNYTKNLVRYHYIRRRIQKDSWKLKHGITHSSNGDLITPEGVDAMITLYNSFSIDFKKDLRMFQIIDDRAK
jgi:hypothetical protein